jgi:hypothetical protein
MLKIISLLGFFLEILKDKIEKVVSKKKFE